MQDVTAVVVTEEKEGHPPGRGRRHGGGGQSAAPRMRGEDANDANARRGGIT